MKPNKKICPYCGKFYRGELDDEHPTCSILLKMKKEEIKNELFSPNN